MNGIFSRSESTSFFFSNVWLRIENWQFFSFSRCNCWFEIWRKELVRYSCGTRWTVHGFSCKDYRIERNGKKIESLDLEERKKELFWLLFTRVLGSWQLVAAAWKWTSLIEKGNNKKIRVDLWTILTDGPT